MWYPDIEKWSVQLDAHNTQRLEQKIAQFQEKVIAILQGQGEVNTFNEWVQALRGIWSLIAWMKETHYKQMGYNMWKNTVSPWMKEHSFMKSIDPSIKKEYDALRKIGAKTEVLRLWIRVEYIIHTILVPQVIENTTGRMLRDMKEKKLLKMREYDALKGLAQKYGMHHSRIPLFASLDHEMQIQKRRRGILDSVDRSLSKILDHENEQITLNRYNTILYEIIRMQKEVDLKINHAISSKLIQLFLTVDLPVSREERRKLREKLREIRFQWNISPELIHFISEND